MDILFMMQLAMLFGFFCAYPMNALLIKVRREKGNVNFIYYFIIAGIYWYIK